MKTLFSISLLLLSITSFSQSIEDKILLQEVKKREIKTDINWTPQVGGFNFERKLKDYKIISDLRNHIKDSINSDYREQMKLIEAKSRLEHKIYTLNRLVEEYGTIYVTSDSYNYNWSKEDEDYLTPKNKEKMASHNAKLAEEKVIREYEERKIDYGFGVKVLVLDKALIIELPERKYYEAEFKTQYTDNSKIYNKKTKKFIEHQTVKNDTIKVYSFLEDKPGTLILLWDLQEKLIRKIANGEVYDVNFKSMRGNVSGGSNRGAEEIRKQLDIELEKDSDISSIVNRKWYSIKTDNKLEINRDILGEYKIIYSSPEGSISGIYLLDGNKLVHKKDRSGYFEFNYNEDDTLDFTNWAYINGKLEKKEIWKFSK